jgi:nitrite reductase/ring-hydroxylating ferredoxin subunit
MDSNNVISEAPWQKLDGLDPSTTAFPARANVAGESILIFRSGTGFRGVQRTCPHLNATLMDAQLVANGTMLRCTQHNYTFKLSDGKGVNCPGFKLRLFEVKHKDADLFARPIA